MNKLYLCIDCNKKLHKLSKYTNAKRCKKCYIEWMKINNKFFNRKSRKGRKNSNYRHGKTYNNHCMDCGKLLGNYRSVRCLSCAKKGNLCVLFGKPPKHGKRIKYNDILFRSTWEVKYAKWLDRQNIKWLYESRTFDLGEATYTPDFYLIGKDVYIEIKGWWRDKAKEKFKLFQKLYSDIKIRVLTLKSLKRLKIL